MPCGGTERCLSVSLMGKVPARSTWTHAGRAGCHMGVDLDLISTTHCPIDLVTEGHPQFHLSSTKRSKLVSRIDPTGPTIYVCGPDRDQNRRVAASDDRAAEAGKPFAATAEGRDANDGGDGGDLRPAQRRAVVTTCRDVCCPSEMLRRPSGRSTYSLSSHRPRWDAGISVAGVAARSLY